MPCLASQHTPAPRVPPLADHGSLVWYYGRSMASVKMTFSLDASTAARLNDAATSLRKPKSEIVR